MRRINPVFLLLLFLVSCITEFDPDIVAEDQSKLVVTGSIISGQEQQTINISMTSPIETPEYIPVTGCQVKVINNSGDEFQFTDMNNGHYSAQIDPALLTAGTVWNVEIITPGGEQIISDSDTLTSGPEVDSVYYIREDIATSDPEIFQKGIRFFVDLIADEDDSRYYMWDMVETWEHHADYPVIWYYDGEVHQVWPPDSSNMYCWTTLHVPEIYTLSTRNLSENRYKKLPLHFVDNISSRLNIGYSLLLSQYALSEKAFTYWEEVRINSDKEGGLYDKQPLRITGNMHNISNPDKEVIGFFYASTLTKKRIFIRNVPDLPLEYTSHCNLRILRVGLVELKPADYPVYLVGDYFGFSLIKMGLECVDCRTEGGVTIKPDFWPF